MRVNLPSSIENRRKPEGEEVAMLKQEDGVRILCGGSAAARRGCGLATGRRSARRHGAAASADVCMAGGYLVKVVRGPVFVTADHQPLAPRARPRPGSARRSRRGHRPSDHVAMQAWACYGGGKLRNKFYRPCEGDPLTDLGELSCHEQAAKINPASSRPVVQGRPRGAEEAHSHVRRRQEGQHGTSLRDPGHGSRRRRQPLRGRQHDREHRLRRLCGRFRARPSTGEVVSATLSPRQSLVGIRRARDGSGRR